MTGKVLKAWAGMFLLLAAASAQNGAGKWDPGQLEYLDTDRAFEKLNLDPAQKTALERAIRKELAGKIDEGPDSEDRIVAKTRIKMVDLNDDGVPEAIVQASSSQVGCGASGNCPIWIFKLRSAGGYERILEEKAQLIKVMPQKTNGYRDFLVGGHNSATEQVLLLYKFSDGEYRQQECYDRRWDENGKESMKPCKKN